MNETSWALLAGLIVIGLGGVFTGTEKVAQQESEVLSEIARELTATLDQIIVNREELGRWTQSSGGITDPNQPLPQIAEIHVGKWAGGLNSFKEFELTQRRAILRINRQIQETNEFLAALKSTPALRATVGKDAKKVFDIAERYCLLELQRRKVEIPPHDDIEAVRKQLTPYMRENRSFRIGSNAYDAAESIVREGYIPEAVKTESLLAWLSSIRAAQGLVEALEEHTDKGMALFDRDKATKADVERLLTMHSQLEEALKRTRDGSLDLACRFQFVVVEVWVNWILGLLYGGAVVFGIGSLFARKAILPWRRKWISLIPAFVGTAAIVYNYADHPPIAEEPGLTCAWVGVYGGFAVGVAAMLMMLFFPALMKAVQRRGFHG